MAEELLIPKLAKAVEMEFGHILAVEANRKEQTMKEADRFATDDITWCMAECDTDCPRKPRYIRDKSIPHSFADFSDKCMAYMMKGADDE